MRLKLHKKANSICKQTSREILWVRCFLEEEPQCIANGEAMRKI